MMSEAITCWCEAAARISGAWLYLLAGVAPHRPWLSRLIPRPPGAPILLRVHGPAKYLPIDACSEMLPVRCSPATYYSSATGNRMSVLLNEATKRLCWVELYRISRPTKQPRQRAMAEERSLGAGKTEPAERNSKSAAGKYKLATTTMEKMVPGDGVQHFS